MALKIVTVGKKHEDWVVAGIERYQKRLRGAFAAEWILLPHSSLEGDQARLEESERITNKLSDDAYIILLDERGMMLDSPGVSTTLQNLTVQGKNMYLIIGGAYGVTDELRMRANIVWSLSPLVFPHQLVRLLVIEQLYRAQQIEAGGSYHHQ